MNIYEQGTLYSTFGHVDPLVFRLQCFKDYGQKPVNIKHQWDRQACSKAKRCYHLIKCNKSDNGAFEITTGEI